MKAAAAALGHAGSGDGEADTSLGHALAQHGGAEGAGGGVGARARRMGGAAPGREPDRLLGARDRGRLRGGASPRPGRAVGGALWARRRRAGARGGGGVPHARRPRGAAAISGRARARSLTARGMRIGGALLLAFVVFHVLHLTFGYFHRSFQSGEVYANVVQGLQVPWVATVYLGGAALLGLHLFHGLWAAARTLGVWPDAAARRHRPVIALISAAMALGFASIPLAVLGGALR